LFGADGLANPLRNAVPAAMYYSERCAQTMTRRRRATTAQEGSTAPLAWVRPPMPTWVCGVAARTDTPPGTSPNDPERAPGGSPPPAAP
jgi:hypothetical protein